MPEKKDDFQFNTENHLFYFVLEDFEDKRNAEGHFLLNYFIFRSFGIVIHTPIPTSDNKNL